MSDETNTPTDSTPADTGVSVPIVPNPVVTPPVQTERPIRPAADPAMDINIAVRSEEPLQPRTPYIPLLEKKES